KRRNRKFDRDFGAIGMFGKGEVLEIAADHGGRVVPGGIGEGAASFVHHDHDVGRDAWTKIHREAATAANQSRIEDEHVVVINVQVIGYLEELIINQQRALVLADHKDFGIGGGTAGGRGGKHVRK